MFSLHFSYKQCWQDEDEIFLFSDKNYLKEIKFWKAENLNSPLYIFDAIISPEILFSKFKVIDAGAVKGNAHTHTLTSYTAIQINRK